MDALLEELIQVPGIPGHEERVRALIEERLPVGTPTATDTMGNLVATIGSGDGGLMFVAHMDEIGFVVTDVSADGFLRLKTLGGIDPRTCFARVLRIITDAGEVPGVVCVKPPHLMSDRTREMQEVPKITEFLVDIGASSAEQVAALGVKVLDFAVLQKTVTMLNGRYVCARALDDRLGCYSLLRAMERLQGTDLGKPVHFAFSVQEEIGLRGATLLAGKYDLDMAFAVDTTSTADWPGVDRALASAELGQGAALRVLDSASVIPVSFRRELQALAEEEGIALQTVFSGGGTDVRPFQTEGPQVMSLAFPVRYTHSAVEMVDRDDVEGVIRLIVSIAKRYAR